MARRAGELGGRRAAREGHEREVGGSCTIGNQVQGGSVGIRRGACAEAAEQGGRAEVAVRRVSLQLEHWSTGFICSLIVHSRKYRAPSHALYRYRINQRITPLQSPSCPLPLLQFCFVVVFFFFLVTRSLSMQDGCNSSRNSPPAPLTTSFHDCYPQMHHYLDGPRQNCEWLPGALHLHRQCIPKTFSRPTERQSRTRLSLVGSASKILQ